MVEKIDLESYMHICNNKNFTLELDCKYYLDYYKCDDNPRNFIYEMSDQSIDYIEWSSKYPNYAKLQLYYTFFKKTSIDYKPNKFISSRRINSFPELPNLKVFKCAGLHILTLPKLENLIELECSEYLIKFILSNRHLFPKLKTIHDFDNKSYYYF